MSGSAHISDLTLRVGSNNWAMVRGHFGIQSFGINAYVAAEAGFPIVEEHDEMGDRSGKHEELYFVSEGRATFTVEGDEIDAPAGTFVFVRDPAAKRKAVAEEAGTTIVIAGGRPGEAFTPSPWERNASGLVYFASKEYDKAVQAYEQMLEETPGDAPALYNLACAESLLGRKAEALEHLRQSVEADPAFKKNAVEDPDFDEIRDEPEFSAITGQPDPARSSS